MSDNKQRFAASVVKFSEYSLPEFKEKKGKPYILSGKKNDFPDYIIKCFQRSAVHSAIIRGKVDYIIGEGWNVTGTQLQPLVNSVNSDENLFEFTTRLAMDIELFGGCYILVTKPLVSSGKIEYRVLPFNRMRTNEYMSEFYYSRHWNKPNPEVQEGWKVYPKYGADTAQSVYYYQGYSPKSCEYSVYPIPEYHAALPWIEIDYEVPNFHLNNIKNSFWGSFLINFYNGIPTPEEQKKIEDQIADKFSGTDAAGKFVLNFADDKDRGAEMQSLLPNQLDKLFNTLNEMTQQGIFTGHQVTSPMLFGVKTAGQLGGRTEMIDAYELFYNNYILPKQKSIEDIINLLFTGRRENRAFELKPKQPIQEQLDVSTTTGILTIPEQRQYLSKRYGITLGNAAGTQQQMRSELTEEKAARIVKRLADVGEDADKFRIIASRKFIFQSESDIDTVEARLLRRVTFAAPTSGNIKDKDGILILEILDSNPDATPSEISKKTNISIDKVKVLITDLTEAGLLDKSGGITPLGDRSLPPVNENITTVELKYRYAKNPTVSGPVLIETSREFCRDIIGFNKLFSRQEIEQISNDEGYSVFLFRGGWYRNPQTGETTPYCRHIWESVAVTKKGE